MYDPLAAVQPQSQPQSVNETLSNKWICQTSVASPWQHWSLLFCLLHAMIGFCYHQQCLNYRQVASGLHRMVRILCQIIYASLHVTRSSLLNSWRFWTCFVTIAMTPFNCVFNMSVIVSWNLLWPASMPLASLYRCFWLADSWSWQVYMSILSSSWAVLMPFLSSSWLDEFLTGCQFVFAIPYIPCNSFICSRITCNAGSILNPTSDTSCTHNIYLVL